MKFKDLNEATKHFAKELLAASPVVSTNPENLERYKNTIGGEFIQQFFQIEDPHKVIGTWENHKPHKWWLYGEILSEMLNIDPPLMYRYNPELFSQHYDLLEDGRMQYTYSNRFVEFNQLVNVYRKLKENPNTKRAVVDIFTPYDTAPDRRDSPCTTMYHFIQRDGKLNMAVFYRSWDFFGGFKTYDLGLSSFIQQSFCSWLNLEPGTLGVYTNSLHYYNRDRANLEKLVKEVDTTTKVSGSLILDEKVGITDYYRQLRSVKAVEEAAYNGNYKKAIEIRDSLNIKMFKDMCDTYIKKNGGQNDKRNI